MLLIWFITKKIIQNVKVKDKAISFLFPYLKSFMWLHPMVAVCTYCRFEVCHYLQAVFSVAVREVLLTLFYRKGNQNMESWGLFPKAVSWNQGPFFLQVCSSKDMLGPKDNKGEGLPLALHTNHMPALNILPYNLTTTHHPWRCSHCRCLLLSDGGWSRLQRRLCGTGRAAAQGSLWSVDQIQAVIVPAALRGKPHCRDRKQDVKTEISKPVATGEASNMWLFQLW